MNEPAWRVAARPLHFHTAPQWSLVQSPREQASEQASEQARVDTTEELWDAFISYKTGADQAAAFELAATLEAQQLKCWIAPRDIPPTNSMIVARGLLARPGYDDAIPFAIEHSSAMVVIVSAAAMRSEHVKDEINLAKDGGLGFFPVRVEEVALQNSFRYHLGRAQWNDCFDPVVPQRFDKVVVDILAYIASQQRIAASLAAPDSRQASRTLLTLQGLSIDGFPISLKDDLFRVLLALAARRHRAVSRNELLDLAFRGSAADDSAVVEAIGALRQILGLQAITTIPGRGYQFCAELDAASLVPAIDDEPLAASPAEAAPAASGSNTFALRSNLPDKLPILLGREDDMAELAALIGQHELVSIVGAGGLGKTCLAQHLLQQQSASYPGGITWIELAALNDPVLLASEIASAIGVQLGGGDPLVNLVAALKPLRAILVLDNAEHLIDEVARVVQAILDGTSQVRLIVTSQLPVKLESERVYRLGTLAVPSTDVDCEQALAYGAVALFVERAQAADRRFVLTAKNVGTVVAICSRLDGLALAIALAAARVASLGVDKLADALQQRLRLLTGGSRTAPARHQTLRAALEWSHGLLNLAEQTVFRRLGVFAGGFTLDMAQSVIADDLDAPSIDHADIVLDEWTVIEILGALVDRSLVMTDANEPPRYRLQESPRAFALEQLAAAKEDAAWRLRHATAVVHYFNRCDAECWDGVIGVDTLVDILGAELDNGREALHWCLQHRPLLAVEFATAFSAALTLDRQQERDLLWTATTGIVARLDAEDAAGQAASLDWQRLRAGWALGCSRSWVARNATLCSRRAREAAAFYRTGTSEADGVNLYLALATLSCAAGAAAPSADALAALQELQQIERPAWPARVRCWGARAAAYIQQGNGEFGAAHRACETQLGFARCSEDSSGTNSVLSNLVYVALATGAVIDAIEHGKVLVARLQGTSHQHVLAFTRINLCAALLANDEVESSTSVAREGWATAVQFKSEHFWADYLALIAALQGRLRHAALICGFADSANLASGIGTREINEAYARNRAEELTRAALAQAPEGVETFDDLHRQGATFDVHQVSGVAFGNDCT